MVPLPVARSKFSLFYVATFLFNAFNQSITENYNRLFIYTVSLIFCLTMPGVVRRKTWIYKKTLGLAHYGGHGNFVWKVILISFKS